MREENPWVEIRKRLGARMVKSTVRVGDYRPVVTMARRIHGVAEILHVDVVGGEGLVEFHHKGSVIMKRLKKKDVDLSWSMKDLLVGFVVPAHQWVELRAPDGAETAITVDYL